MTTKALVLFSGGQDSTTCLYLARVLYDEVSAVSVFYGQRHRDELMAAAEVAKLAKVPHQVLNLAALGQLGGSSLTDVLMPVTGSATTGFLDGTTVLPTSYVPGRNMLLLSMAAAVAVQVGARDVLTGVCQTDYSGYPDCRREFVDAFERAATFGMPSSCGPIRVATPLMHMTKAETVRLARRLPGCWQALALSLTCYQGHRPGCGECGACVLRAKGFEEAGEVDPAVA